MDTAAMALTLVPRGCECDGGQSLKDSHLVTTRALGRLADVANRLQTLIRAALTGDAATSAEHLREFHAIDLLVQRLHGVATFIDHISKDVAPEWRINTSSAVAAIALSHLGKCSVGRFDLAEESTTRTPAIFSCLCDRC